MLEYIHALSMITTLQAWKYLCKVSECTVLINYDNRICRHTRLILVPAPASVNLFSNNPTWPIGSDVNLTCSIQLNPAVMAANRSLLMMNIDIYRNQIPFDQSWELITTDMNITYTTQLHPFERNHSGIYSCTAIIISTVSYLTASDPVTDSTKISTG